MGGNNTEAGTIADELGTAAAEEEEEEEQQAVVPEWSQRQNSHRSNSVVDEADEALKNIEPRSRGSSASRVRREKSPSVAPSEHPAASERSNGSSERREKQAKERSSASTQREGKGKETEEERKERKERERRKAKSKEREKGMSVDLGLTREGLERPLPSNHHPR